MSDRDRRWHRRVQLLSVIGGAVACIALTLAVLALVYLAEYRLAGLIALLAAATCGFHVWNFRRFRTTHDAR